MPKSFKKKIITIIENKIKIKFFVMLLMKIFEKLSCICYISKLTYIILSYGNYFYKLICFIWITLKLMSRSLT